MSDKGPSCFGKLPFNLLDRLQTDVGGSSRNWLDAVEVPVGNSCVTSIDTVTLVPGNLPDSIAIGIMHAMNDIFSSNALPCWFSLSMTLPLDSDIDVLSRINGTISDLARLTECGVGKLHTIRADREPNLTACVGGVRTGMSSKVPQSGFVLLCGCINPSRFSLEAAASAMAVRKKLSSGVHGPKKDVSGDGLAGALFQMCVRESVSIELGAGGLQQIAPPSIELEDLTKNFLDYACAVSGEYVERFRMQLFSPRIFGPIVCLVDKDAEFDRSDSLVIGTFEQGPPRLGISEK